MTPRLLAAAVTSRTCKTMKDVVLVFERKGNLLQKCILHFAISLS